MKDLIWFISKSKNYKNYEGMNLLSKIVFWFHVPMVYRSYRKYCRISEVSNG